MRLDLDNVMEWRFSSNGVYSTKPFCLKVENSIANISVGTPAASQAWNGLTPPCTEILVRFVLQGRLNTTKRLVVLHIIPPVATVCPFCVLAVESIAHIFIDFRYSWRWPIAFFGGSCHGVVQRNHWIFLKHGAVLD